MKRIKQWVLAATVVGLVAACAAVKEGADEAALAAELAAAGNYAGAVNYMVAALDKKPNDPEYREKLQRYKDEYATSLLDEAETLLDGELSQAVLTSIDKLLAEAEALELESERYDAIQADLADKREKFNERLARDYTRFNSALAQGQWSTTKAVYEEFMAVAPDYEDVSSKYETAVARFRSGALASASAHVKADEIAEAIAVLEQLLVIDPENGIAANLLKSAKAKDNAAYYLKKADDSYAQQDWERLIWLCQRVARYDAGNSRCQGFIAEAGDNLFDLKRAEIDEALEGGYVFRAAQGVIALKELRSGKTAAAYIAVSDRVKRELARAGDEAVDTEWFGVAARLFDVLQKIDPSERSVEARIREVNDELQARARREIAVLDFKSPSNIPDAGVIVANVLRSKLFKSASRDIVILERDNVTSLLEEMKLGQIGVVSDKTARAMGEMFGLDYTIMGSVLLYKVDSDKTTNSKTVKYKVGEEIVDNIEYLNWKSTHPNASASELREAPQAKITKEVFEFREYMVESQKKVAFLSLSFRMVDIQTGENTRVDTIEQTMRVEDEANQGVAEAGIELDPLEIPTDTELLQALGEEVIANMVSEILRPLQSLEKVYFEKAQEFDRRGEYKDAVEYYTLAAVDEQLKSVAMSPITRNSSERIDALLLDMSL